MIVLSDKSCSQSYNRPLKGDAIWPSEPEVGLTTLVSRGGKVGTAPRAVLADFSPSEDAMVITSLPVERGRSTLPDLPRSARSADPTHGRFQQLAAGRFKPLNGRPETGKFAAAIIYQDPQPIIRSPVSPLSITILCLEGWADHPWSAAVTR